MRLTGATRVAGVIGDPIRHSRSPLILNAAFAAADLDWVFLAFPVAAGAAPAALAAMRTLGLAGLSVTTPHKADVAAAVDRCTPAAAALGAVNCVAWEGDELVGHNTDGAGLVDALRVDEGIDLEGRSVGVVGAGGAARAVVRALADAGASRVIVVNRSRDRAEVAAALAGNVGSVGTANDLADVDVIVQATSVGMGDGEVPFDPAVLHAGQLLVDIVYEPLVTPLMTEARRRGVHAVNGVGMLVHQAAHAFRLWTEAAPPLEAMSAAVVASLAEHVVLEP